MTPAWILDTLAAVMLVVAAVSAGRLAAARPWQQGSGVIDTDVAHLLMAIAMAGMLAPGLSTPLPSTAWEVIFGLMTAWFAVRVVLDARASGVRALAGGHCAPHLVHSAAMLYMFLALTTPDAGMSGMSAGSGSMTLDHPTLAFIFAIILIGYTVWDLDQLSGRRYSFGTAGMSLAGAGMPAVTAMAAAESLAATLPGSSTAEADPPPAADGHAAGGAAGGAGELLLSPAVTVGCRIVMGIAMAFMLITAL
jgi:Domain of unknown function (DUF5134)